MKTEKVNIKRKNLKISSPPPGVMIVLYALYLCMIALDVISTYLGTPDLSFEGNPLIVYFQMSWTSIVIASFLGSTLLFLLFSLSLASLYDGRRGREFSLLGIAVFIWHFSYSVFTIINNILSGVFVEAIELPGLSPFADWYINTFVMDNSHFYPVVLGLHAFFSFVFVRKAFNRGNFVKTLKGNVK